MPSQPLTDPPRVVLLGSTRLTRVALPWLCDQGRARVVGVDLGEEDEGLPWFAPVRQLARDHGVPFGRFPADLVLDLDPDARPTRGEGVMVRVLAPPGAPSADVNRALLTGGEWEMVVTPPDGASAWAREPVIVRPDDDGASLLEDATLRGIEALAASLEAILAGAAPEPLPRPLKAGRFRAQETHLLWERPAAAIVARIRACAGPWGGAITHVGETLVRLQDARIVADETPPEWLPGTITALDDALDIATGRGIVRVERLRPGWRPVRRAAEWAREVGVSPGYRVE